MKIIKSNRFFILALTLTLGGALIAMAFASTSVFADVNACNELPSNSVAYEAAGCGNTSQNGLFNVIQAILNTIIGVTGIIAVIFIVVGGFQYMSSTGDPSKTKKAKDTILYAVIGLIVCVLAFAIVNFVLATILHKD